MSEEADIQGQSESRSKWSHPLEFVLSCIGYSVGLGNVWRFPYLCFKHGGAAFLLVYLFLQLTIGKPLYFMELALAQSAGKGPVNVWDCNPAARGLGLAMCLISLNISLYYNIIMAYVLYYFVASFLPTLPWQKCKKEWEGCFIGWDSLKNMKCSARGPGNVTNTTCLCTGDAKIDDLYEECSTPRHASYFVFHKDVLQESDNLSDFGVPSWKLSLLLLLSWIVVIICMIRGIRSTGKVVYFTATFPYVVLLILLVRGAALDGAMDGIKFFIIPKWKKLQETQLWIDAAGQMFFSLGLSMGGILMFGSYNLFHHRVYRDAVIITSMDLVTSLLAGFVIFTTFGYMAKEVGSTISEVTKSGYGLAFVAYPEILTTLSLPNLWTFLFFFMLYTLGLDSQFALLETATSYLIDDFRTCRHHKTMLRVVFGIVLYSLGLLLVCPGGQYLINIIDIYGSAYPLSVISLLETIAVMWTYGMHRFMNDLEYMLGRAPGCTFYWHFVWLFWDPLFLICLLVVVLAMSEIPTYNDGSRYGAAAMASCWILYSFTLSPIPLWFFLHFRAVYRKHGYTNFRQFMVKLLEPSKRWGPADGSQPLTLKNTASVWADVLDWKVFSTNTAAAGSSHAVPEPDEPNVTSTNKAEVTESDTTERQREGMEGGETSPGDMIQPPLPLSPEEAEAQRRMSHSVD